MIQRDVPMIEARNISHWYPGTGHLFEDLTFRLRGGEVAAVVGPSGSGKSTLLSILEGWERPRSGEIRRNGVARSGWVFQNPHGMARRTALDHVTFPLLTQGLSWAAAELRARDILEAFQLTASAEKPFAALSGGEGQRVMLARMLAFNPQLILVDEPTAQLDAEMASTVNGVLRSLSNEGAIVVVATHDAATAGVCDRAIDLGKGRMSVPREPL